MPAVSIICLGPTGLGYFCDAPDLPEQDKGLVTDRHGALLVCDAAIVAYVCARRYPGRVHLVTNNLGSAVHESQAIQAKLGLGVTVHPDPLPFKGAPIDMIFIDRSRGTRSFVTTNYFPTVSHILTTTRNLYASLIPEARSVLYADIEASTDGGRNALESTPSVAMSSASVWNVGQVAELSNVTDWLSGTVLPEGAVIQASLGESKVTAPELRSTYRRLSSAPRQTLVVTLGSSGAAWVDDRNTEIVAVSPISNAFTLGAGAVLASSLVMGLAAEEVPDIGSVVSDAITAATRYVRDATVTNDLHGLDYW